jgi:plastocyanin
MKKNYLILLGITLVLVVACGCTQPALPVQPTATPTMNVQTTSLPVVTTTSFPPSTISVTYTVRISNFAFDPSDITVKAGSTVRWVNGDSVPHRIKFDDEHFSAFLIGAGQSGSQKFDERGVYPYICLIHPEMQGTVRVE